MKNSTERPTSKVSEEMHNLIHQIYQTSKALTKSINRALYSTNIYGSEWAIIRAVKQEGTMTQTALSTYLNIEPAAISKTLRQLSQKNLIIRKPGEDRREKYIYLSEVAEENYSVWEELIENNCNKIAQSLSEEDYHRLLEILKSIQDNLDDVD